MNFIPYTLGEQQTWCLSIRTSRLHSKEWCTTSISGKYRSSCCCFPGAQEVSSLLGLPQCSAGCSLGLCSCLWLAPPYVSLAECGFSSAELRSKPCWCNCASLPVPVASLGWEEHRQPQDSHLQHRRCQPGRKLWDQAVLQSICLRLCPRNCPDVLQALTLCHQSSSASSKCWLLYPKAISKVPTTWTFPTTENKVVYEDNGSYWMNYKSSLIPNWHLRQCEQQNTSTQISSRLLCALQWELKMRGLSSIVL